MSFVKYTLICARDLILIKLPLLITTSMLVVFFFENLKSWPFCTLNECTMSHKMTRDKVISVQNPWKIRLKQISCYAQGKLIKAYKGENSFAVVLFCFFNKSR